MSTSPVEFTGWDAYKYTPLKGTFEQRIPGTQNWVEHDGDSFNCACTYRFTPTERKSVPERAAEEAAKKWYESGQWSNNAPITSSYEAGFKEGALWHARELRAQTDRTAAQRKREQQDIEGNWGSQPPILARDPEQDYVKLQESIRTDA